MQSFSSRVNAIFAFTVTVIGVMGAGLYLTTFIYPNTGQIKLGTRQVQVKNALELTAGRKKNDLAFVNFDLDVDLTSLFNWNVKQLFLYLTAEYTTKTNQLNQVVLWDKILLKKDNKILNLKNLKTKYNFWDDGDGLRGNDNVTLTLSWNIIPNVGGLPLVRAIGEHTLAIPGQYSTSTR